MATGPDDPDLLRPDEWWEVAKLTTAKAKEMNLLLPFEAHITDANDELVCHLLFEPDEKGQVKVHSLEPDSELKELTGRFPLTAVLEDKDKALEITITRPMTQ